MKYDIDRLLQKKNVLVTGGSLAERQELWEQARASWPRAPEPTGVFILKEGLATPAKFLAAVAKTLPLTSPLGLSPSAMSLDQINDYFLEWPYERRYRSALIIWPEMHKLWKAAPESVHEILGSLLSYSNTYQLAGVCTLRVLLTSSDPVVLDPAKVPTEARALPPSFKAAAGRRPKTFTELLEIVTLTKA